MRKSSLESMGVIAARHFKMVDKKFWTNRKVFVTGHTGFKGSWLCLWLHSLGAKIAGYALKPPTQPSLYELCHIEGLVKSIIADVREGKSLLKVMREVGPEVVIHMAAQSLVRDSYRNPFETYSTNVMGTVTLFEAVRKCKNIRAVINVTTDKCYENREWFWGYRENEPMGGFDPYSNSKACSELVTSSYRSSFFNPKDYPVHKVAVASARSGNVIGGGDWATDRLVPDCLRSLLKGEKIRIRSPQAIRPWQHVLEPLSGYLILAQKLYEQGSQYAESWNFGPEDQNAKTVEWIVKEICTQWGENASYEVDPGNHPHEANYLKLDCSKAKGLLGWAPRWDLAKAIDKVVEWVRVYLRNGDVREVCIRQIEEYMCGNDPHRNT